MKNYFICIFLSMLFSFPIESTAQKVKSKKVQINTENDAKIFVDGKQVGSSSTQLTVPAYSTVNVRIEKVGFITEERNYVNNGKHEIPKSDYLKLEKDDAYESSLVTDLANQDVDVRTSHSEDDSWKLIARIITNNFDVIQISDKSTGYMCTAWVVKSFRSATVRTRLIIKTTSSDPLAYKAKLISEIAPSSTSASADESFRPWDRILRSFENVVPELQSRLGK